LKGKSIELAIYNFLNAIYYSLECSKNCVGIFYDFSKAFDLVQHEILFKKLSSLGVNGKPLEFVKSYLLDRKYYVQLSESDADGNIVDHESDVRIWNRGVPQGSNLDPYLFLVMINDLPSHLTNKLFAMFVDEDFDFIDSIYADDVNTILSSKNYELLEKICNYSINLLYTWYSINGLKLNVNKTCYTQFKSSHNRFVNPEPTLLLDKNILSSTPNCVFLGLRIIENLNWDIHANYICNKLRSGCFALGLLRNEVTKSTLKTVYYAHI
jgi:hypothetical protein